MNVLSLHNKLEGFPAKGAGTITITGYGNVQWFIHENVPDDYKLNEQAAVKVEGSGADLLQKVVHQIKQMIGEKPSLFEGLPERLKDSLKDEGIASDEDIQLVLVELLSGELKVPGVGEASLEKLSEVYNA